MNNELLTKTEKTWNLEVKFWVEKDFSWPVIQVDEWIQERKSVETICNE